MSEQRAARTLEERISELAASRPAVAAQMATVARERATALDATRAAGHRLRPSGGLGRELRDHPLRAVGLVGLLILLAARWFGRDTGNSGRKSAAGAFVQGVASAAAVRGGRALVDALIDGTPRGQEVDESPSSDDDVRGRVAKR